MIKCNLCPRGCGADRSLGTGFCGVGAEIMIGRAAPHMWEEPCISGKNGSGTVFFCGCTLGCVYCQNYRISRNGCEISGSKVTENELANIFIELEFRGVHNINLVTPTMFVPSVSKAVDISKSRGMTLPIVYNTSGYELTRTLELMDGRIDIYLPDFKYVSSDMSKRYSSAEDYPEYALSSLEYMVNKLGAAVFDNSGMMKRGVIVRHLLLPGQLKESLRVLDCLYSRFGNSIYYSLMCQYTPTDGLDRNKYPELTRKVTTYEYSKLIDYALSIGIKNGFTQEREAAKESFIPDFGKL